MRTLVVGGPGVGKTTLSNMIAEQDGVPIRHTDDLIPEHEWSTASEKVAAWFDADGPWIIEGVAVVRALRKWMATNAGKPADLVLLGMTPKRKLTPGQRTMTKGHETVWREVRGELAKRGVEVRFLELEMATRSKTMRTDAKPKKILQGQLFGLDRYSRSVSILASTQNPAGDQEAITSWDFSAWEKNPIILWAHDQAGHRLPIGVGEEHEFGPEGLKVRVRFASAAANPLAEQIWQGTSEQIFRAVSVGYEPLGNGLAKLLEISFVPVGLDENAGTESLNPEAVLSDDDVKARVTSAASEMAKHRARIMKKLRGTKTASDEDAFSPADANAVSGDRTDAADVVYRMDRTELRLDKFEDTPSGGKKIPSRLSRIGVLEYMNPDGSIRRELRKPEEVFKADSLRTLEHAVVIDIKNHTGMVTPDTWKDVALGSVVNARHDAKFIEGDLIINDGMTLDSIEDGERREISLGYTCRLVAESGEWNGEKFDCVQTDIRYNHAALCPPNRGRAGPEVGLRLDHQSPSWAITHLDEGEPHMSAAAVKILIRLDGREYEKGSDEHLAKMESVHAAELTKIRTDAKTESDKVVSIEKARADKAEGERDALKVSLDAATSKAAEEKTKREADEKLAEEERTKKARSRRRLERFFSRYFSGEDDMDDEEEGEERSFPPGEEGEKEKEKAKKAKKSRMDAFDAKLDSMSDRELMIVSIQRSGDTRFDGKDENGKDRTEDYLRARFDAAVDKAQEGRSIHGVTRNAVALNGRLDAADAATDGVSKARAERDKRMLEIGRK